MSSHLNFLSKKRRSVRRYGEKPISQEALQDILEAGLRAPTSKNTRATFFILTEDREKIEHLSRCRDHGSQFLANAPLVVVVCADGDKTGRPYSDCAIAAAYMQLAVTDNDLGSCWCHVEDSPSPSGGTAEEYVRDFLKLPPSTKVLCMIGIGEVTRLQDLLPRERPVEWERAFVEEYEERK